MRQWQKHSNEEQQQDDDENNEELPDDEFYEDESDDDEEVEEETKKISVKVKRGDVEENEEPYLSIKIDEDVELRWLMIHYCDKVGLNYNRSTFYYNGAIIRDCDTPKQLYMVDDDIVYVYFGFIGTHGDSAVKYTTLCIRMQNQRDVFMRVNHNESIFRQAQRHLSNGEPGKLTPACFMIKGERLTEDNVPDDFDLVDGDVIDAFDLNEISSSWSIASKHLTLKVRGHGSNNLNTFKVSRRTPLRKMMTRYAEMYSINCDGFLFYFKGRRLSPDSTVTVDEAQLKDGSEIDAYRTL